jgi:hypothetical protein
MRKFYYLALIALVGIAFSSCTSTNTPEFRLSDLQGLWQENNTEHYVRFTDEQSDEKGYFYGLEWNEGEDKYEQDLIDAREELGHPGNGWFKYDFETNGSLTEIHLMDNGGAEIPKVYVVSKLTDTVLEYYEKDNKSWSYSFTKIVVK